MPSLGVNGNIWFVPSLPKKSVGSSVTVTRWRPIVYTAIGMSVQGEITTNRELASAARAISAGRWHEAVAQLTGLAATAVAGPFAGVLASEAANTVGQFLARSADRRLQEADARLATEAERAELVSEYLRTAFDTVLKEARLQQGEPNETARSAEQLELRGQELRDRLELIVQQQAYVTARESGDVTVHGGC